MNKVFQHFNNDDLSRILRNTLIFPKAINKRIQQLSYDKTIRRDFFQNRI